MEASVMSPSCKTEVCDVIDVGEGHYSIKFVPKEMGVHTVSVKHKGIHIPGEWSRTYQQWQCYGGNPAGKVLSVQHEMSDFCINHCAKSSK